MNGATAQADILGIFGRENLDLGVRWTTPAASTPTFKAMKMYRNYDGNRSGFGDISVSAAAPQLDVLSAFAAVRSSDGALTVMAINKTNVWSPVNLALSNYYAAGTAQVWQLTASNIIARLPDIAFSGNLITNTLPPQSVTLFIAPPGDRPKLTPAAWTGGNTLDITVAGPAGQRFALQFSTNLASWESLRTNSLDGGTLKWTVPIGTSRGYYRAIWMP
jgi:hypothetical protein